MVFPIARNYFQECELNLAWSHLLLSIMEYVQVFHHSCCYSHFCAGIVLPPALFCCWKLTTNHENKLPSNRGICIWNSQVWAANNGLWTSNQTDAAETKPQTFWELACNQTVLSAGGYSNQLLELKGQREWERKRYREIERRFLILGLAPLKKRWEEWRRELEERKPTETNGREDVLNSKNIGWSND